MKHVSMLTVRRRLIIVFFLLAVYFLIMFGRLAFVQLVSGDEIMESAEDLWTRDIPFQAERGEILDRNGEVLVGNTVAPSLAVVPKQIEDPEKVADELMSIISIDREKLMEHLTNNVSCRDDSPRRKKIIENCKQMKFVI